VESEAALIKPAPDNIAKLTGDKRASSTVNVSVF